MGKKKKKEEPLSSKISARRLNKRDWKIFEYKRRSVGCLFESAGSLISIANIDSARIRDDLGYKCDTIESQFQVLRRSICLTKKDFSRRYEFTSRLLDCLLAHHRIVYEGVLFGSSINGLGFRDSDVDVRLRPLERISTSCFEPIKYDQDMVERTLRNIAFQTTRCSPAIGEYHPSSRCPIAKLYFLTGDCRNVKSLQKGINYDISLSPLNYLGSFNSLYLRFLCQLEPKFHSLATILRYWSKVHELIQPGYLSSYALVNMLIFFCQTTSPPLLPTVDKMRDVYLAQKENKQLKNRALTQIEWHCLLSLNKSHYPKSKNNEPLGVLLLKFFELYLNFPYNSHILTSRTGRALQKEEFQRSPQYHPNFPVKNYLNIQDPFDLKHNLTSGMGGESFRKLIIVIRYSYERLFRELMSNFKRPRHIINNGTMEKQSNNDNKKKENNSPKTDYRDWGLNALFVKLTDNEFKDA